MATKRLTKGQKAIAARIKKGDKAIARQQKVAKRIETRVKKLDVRASTLQKRIDKTSKPLEKIAEKEKKWDAQKRKLQAKLNGNSGAREELEDPVDLPADDDETVESAEAE